MYKLILADDTEINVGLCGTYDDGPLYIEVMDKSFIECSQIFSDPSKTAVMEFRTALEHAVYEGYTNLKSMQLENGCIKVTMRRSA